MSIGVSILILKDVIPLGLLDISYMYTHPN